MCRTHYMRWYTTGETGSGEIRGYARRECSVEGCARPHRSGGYCTGHYDRMRWTGDPGPVDFEPRRPGATCSIEDCDRPTAGLGWCDKHYQRYRSTGDPTTPLPERGPRWVGDSVSYNGMHQRIGKLRGPARDQKCVSCGEVANHWAYDHTDPAPKVESGKPYSLDPQRYRPMCQPCHRRMDAERTRTKGCSEPDCDRPHKSRGLCGRHYQRWLKERREQAEGSS